MSSPLARFFTAPPWFFKKKPKTSAFCVGAVSAEERFFDATFGVRSATAAADDRREGAIALSRTDTIKAIGRFGKVSRT